MRNVSRRGVLMGFGAVAALFAAGGVARALKPRALMRPPTVESEDDFLSRCIRCERCVNVCHARIIQPTSIIDGIAVAGTPSVMFLHDYCDFCADANGGVPRCAQVCPTQALRLTDREPYVSAEAAIDEHNCLAFNQDACRICVDACPRRAISQDYRGRPVVDSSACDGCGLCEVKCPSVAIGNTSDLIGSGKGIVLHPRESAPGHLEKGGRR